MSEISPRIPGLRVLTGDTERGSPVKSVRDQNIEKIKEVVRSEETPPILGGDIALLNDPGLTIRRTEEGKIECAAGSERLIIDFIKTTYVYETTSGVGDIYNFSGEKIYTGEIKEGEPEGTGTMSSNGRIASGTFINGKLHGEGSIVIPGVVSITGRFVEDKLNGSGTKVYIDGTRDEGTFVDDTLQGEGKTIKPDGTIYTGTFVNGQLQGAGWLSSPGSPIRSVTFVDGKPSLSLLPSFVTLSSYEAKVEKVEKPKEEAMYNSEDRTFIRGVFRGSDFVEGGALSDVKLALLLIGAGDKTSPGYVMNCLIKHLRTYAEGKESSNVIKNFLSLMNTNLEILKTERVLRKEKMGERLRNEGVILTEILTDTHLILVKVENQESSNELVVTVHNSGLGIKEFHKKSTEGEKYQTSLSFRVSSEKRGELLELLAGVSPSGSIKDFYESVKLLGDEIPNEEEDASTYQTPQKSNNCALECYMAAALSILGREQYEAYRLDLMKAVRTAIKVKQSRGAESKEAGIAAAGGTDSAPVEDVSEAAESKVSESREDKIGRLRKIATMEGDRTDLILAELDRKIAKRESRLSTMGAAASRGVEEEGASE